MTRKYFPSNSFQSREIGKKLVSAVFRLRDSISDSEKYFIERNDDPDSLESDTKSGVIQAVEDWRRNTLSIADSSQTYDEGENIQDDPIPVKERFIDPEITDAFSKLNLNPNENSNSKLDAMKLKRMKRLNKSDGDISGFKEHDDVDNRYFPTYLSERDDRSKDLENNWDKFKKLQSQLNPQAETYQPPICIEPPSTIHQTNKTNILASQVDCSQSHANQKVMANNKMMSLLNDLPEDHSLFEEKQLDTLPKQSNQTYDCDYAENVKSRSHFPRFHSTYTVIPKGKNEYINQPEGLNRQHQTITHHKEPFAAKTSRQDIKLPARQHNKEQKNKGHEMSQAESIIQIMGVMRRKTSVVMATRVEPELADELQAQIQDLRYYPMAKIVALGQNSESFQGKISILTAGTADLPVAEEAAITAELCGFKVDRLWDVGVAGIHRLLNHRHVIDKADVLIVVAGMEGALPSVVAGLVSCPVIAVPTSIGYGASFEGLSALLTMLNSCATGIGVVNIDNGFGAAMLAGQILRVANKFYNQEHKA